MKVWLYYRLSRDEDKELNSLTNQKEILLEYAETHGHEVVGESCDDNVSGMHFDREGIERLQEEAEKNSFEAVIVKDLSRLGRHKTQTALFIDYLRRLDIRVLSVTENIDTFNESDDLMIGFKGLINDSYCRDMSRKIRSGYKQKQKAGIVLIPPMGYVKDKNTGKVEIVEEQAEIVRRIYDLYLSGYGFKAIAASLNADGIRSQGYYQLQTLGKGIGKNRPQIAQQFLWEGTRVKRVLCNEFYAGTLICHRSYTNKINHIHKELPPDEQFRHEDFVPAIVSKDAFDRVQELMKEKNRHNVRAAPGKPFHRYTGLIRCGDCGSVFTCRTRRWRDLPERYEYTCNGYHRYGKEHCTSHRIDEDDLDRLIFGELRRLRDCIRKNYTELEDCVRRFASRRSGTEETIRHLTAQLAQRKEDQKQILLERLRDRTHADVYGEMLTACEADIEALDGKISALRDYESTVRKRKKEMDSGLALFDQILDESAVSNANLRLLIEEIVVYEKGGELSLTVKLKAPFRRHLDVYEDGELTDRFFECGPSGED